MTLRSLLACCFLGLVHVPAVADELPTERRIAAQRAIEQVYWSHRIWPAGNPGPKPALDTVLSEVQIRSRVEDYIEKSNALRTRWGRPITTEALRAEMTRMARDTRDPEMLAELFGALGNDPAWIAETLVRQKLADRLIRRAFASDGQIHGARRAAAVAARSACEIVDCMPAMGGEYERTVWRLRGTEHALRHSDPATGSIVVEAEEWARQRARLAGKLGGLSGPVPLHKLSVVEETNDAYRVTALLAETPAEIEVATVTWKKETFDGWWRAQRSQFGLDLEPSTGPFTLPTPTGGSCSIESWSPTLLDVADPRMDHTAVWTGAEMIVWGGHANGEINTGGRYDPATDTWSLTSTGMNVPSPRYGHSTVWTGTRMVVWGGAISEAYVFAVNTGGRYDPSTDTWEPTSTGANSPSARLKHSAVWTGDKMIVWGGSPDDFTSVNSGGRYDPNTDAWEPTQVSAATPPPRYDHSVVWTGSRMIVWGGYDIDHAVLTGGRYDPVADSWTATSTGANVPTARGQHTAVWTGSRMIVWGGSDLYSENPQNTGALYNPSNNTWTPTSIGVNVPSARAAHTALWTGSHMIVWGGEPGLFSILDTGGRYDPATNTWTATATTNTSSARTHHTAVWTGAEMIVWGGRATTGFSGSNTGGRYSSVTDSWTVTSTGDDIPTASARHASVWTGAEMIVWGGTGLSSGGSSSTGARYEPATDTWVPTSNTSAPTGRYSPTAVWTGSEMILWGGFANWAENGLSTGARYNPTADQWVPTATDAGTPSARGDHVAVWTGSRMVVWGGRSESTNLNTGGRYNPVTNGWSPTSIGANVPSARAQATAVWTGTRMIVWGGAAWPEQIGLSTGGRYNPTTDQWLATANGPSTPVARLRHTAVWTGALMIVWGGMPVYTSTGFSSGGRYNPATDVWVSTTTVGAPAARFDHTAVWTGTGMIVWGGQNLELERAGGTYDPAMDSWRPMSASLADSPLGRFNHTAVWTGGEMIVWGGSPLTASGGRYSLVADEDCDTVQDELDCAPADGGAFAAPGEVSGVRFSEKNTLAWTSALPTAGSDTVHDVVRGSLGQLPVGSSPSEVCRSSGLSNATASVPTTPASGAGYWYLVRGRNTCGVGSYGSSSAGVPRETSACPATP